MYTYRIEVMQGRSQTWYWRLMSHNGQVMAHSENYANKSNAVRAGRTISKAAGFPIYISKGWNKS